MLPLPWAMGCTQGEGGLAAGGSDALLELRLARTAPTPGYTYMVPVDATEPVYVSGETLVSDHDIVEADTARTPGWLILNVQLTVAGATRLAQAATDHVGDRLATLVHGKLVTTSLIVTPMEPTPAMPLTMGVPAGGEDLDVLAAEVASRWPH